MLADTVAKTRLTFMTREGSGNTTMSECSNGYWIDDIVPKHALSTGSFLLMRGWHEHPDRTLRDVLTSNQRSPLDDKNAKAVLSLNAE